MLGGRLCWEGVLLQPIKSDLLLLELCGFFEVNNTEDLNCHQDTRDSSHVQVSVCMCGLLNTHIAAGPGVGVTVKLCLPSSIQDDYEF